MYEDVAYLEKAKEAQDEYGNIVQEYEPRQVYVLERSVTRSEFYEAATAGLKPSIVLVLSNRADYNGEKRVEYKGIGYDVVRTYTTGDAIELTLEERIK